MPASGQSSNRRYEQYRGLNSGGHGPYALQGAAMRSDDPEAKPRIKQHPIREVLKRIFR